MTNEPKIDRELLSIISDPEQRAMFLSTLSGELKESLTEVFALSGKDGRRKIHLGRIDPVIIEAIKLAEIRWDKLNPAVQTNPEAVALQQGKLKEVIGSMLVAEAAHDDEGPVNGVERKGAANRALNKTVDKIDDVLREFTGTGRAK